jgi:hypothetical protein
MPHVDPSKNGGNDGMTTSDEEGNSIDATVNQPENRLIAIKTVGQKYMATEHILVVEALLNQGWDIRRGYSNDSGFLLHLTRNADEEPLKPPELLMATAIEVDIPKLKVDEVYDPEKDPILRLTRTGWQLKNLYSGKGQLVRMEPPKPEEPKTGITLRGETDE